MALELEVSEDDYEDTTPPAFTVGEGGSFGGWFADMIAPLFMGMPSEFFDSLDDDHGEGD